MRRKTEPAARALRMGFVDDELLDRLMVASSQHGVELTGEIGFLSELVKAVLQRGMRVELTGLWAIRGMIRLTGVPAVPTTGPHGRRWARRWALSGGASPRS